MALERASVVRKADALVREGKLDQAIAEYRALVDENPGDSGAANTLGDLYARMGDTGRAIEQYTRLGESEWLQGFSAKAAAFYKKALKVDPNCEGALARLGEIAASQSARRRGRPPASG
jgi:tetratricopeptide (TPR) repeat protein